MKTIKPVLPVDKNFQPTALAKVDGRLRPRILLATPLYPPAIGGPALYAVNLERVWRAAGHEVRVVSYQRKFWFPAPLRHLLYFLEVLWHGWDADLILVLDTWSAAIPTSLAAWCLRKKYLIRIGGDFLWERYVERTGDLVLLREFYQTRQARFTLKEKITFVLTRLIVRQAQALIFSTEWQKNIFAPAYRLAPERVCVVNNYCGGRVEPLPPQGRVLVAGSRPIKLKNQTAVAQALVLALEKIQQKGQEAVSLDFSTADYETFFEKIRRAYAVVIGSLSEVSPNLALEAIRAGVPFIMTKESGLAETLRDVALLFDPRSVEDLAEKITWLADPAQREAQAKKVQAYSGKRSWEQVAREVMEIWKKTC